MPTVSLGVRVMVCASGGGCECACHGVRVWRWLWVCVPSTSLGWRCCVCLRAKCLLSCVCLYTCVSVFAAATEARVSRVEPTVGQSAGGTLVSVYPDDTTGLYDWFFTTEATHIRLHNDTVDLVSGRRDVYAA